MNDRAHDAPLFTVLTPTFNRAALLPRAAESLSQQSERDFEWVVVDDGSTDATRETVAQLAAKIGFPIRYVWQPNGHKKAALNHGFRIARGRYTIVLDSDDELTPDALEKFRAAWQALGPEVVENYSSVRALCIDDRGKIVGDCFPADSFDSTYSELLFKYGIQGEKLSCDRTDLLRRYPMPENLKGFVPEHVLWTQLSGPHLTRCINHPVRIYAETDLSLSQRLVAGRGARDAEALAYSYAFVLDHDHAWFWHAPFVFIKAAGNRTRFAAHLKRSGSTARFHPKTLRGRVLNAAFGWLGWPLYFRDRKRERRAE